MEQARFGPALCRQQNTLATFGLLGRLMHRHGARAVPGKMCNDFSTGNRDKQKGQRIFAIRRNVKML
jgi:hypothetical protein